MPLNRNQHKQRARQVFIVKSGGPTNVTRSTPVIGLLDGIIDDYALKTEIPASTDAFAPIAEDQYGTHPDFTTQAALNAYVLAAVANGTAVTVPAAPTGAQVDDVGNIFSHATVPGFASASEYELEKAEVAAGYSTPAGIYAQSGRIYYPDITGPHSISSVRARVKASGNRPAGAFVANAQAFTGPVAPVATMPSPVAQIDVTPGNGQVTVNIQAPADGGSPILSYRYEYRMNTSSTYLVAGTTSNLSLIVTGLTNGTAYKFRAFATNAVGTSAVGTVAGATPVAPAPPVGTNYKYILDGMSIVAGQDGDFAGPLQSKLTSVLANNGDASQTIAMVNFAVGGQTTASMLSDQSSQILPAYDASKRRNVFIIWEAYNALRLDVNLSAQSAFNQLKTYCQNIKAQYPTALTIVGTPPYDKSRDPAYPVLANFEERRQGVRQLLLQAKSAGESWLSAVADIAGDTAIDPAITTQSQDGIHYLPAGQDLITRRFAHAVEEAQYGVPQPAPYMLQQTIIDRFETPTGTGNNYLTGYAQLAVATGVGATDVASNNGVVTPYAYATEYGVYSKKTACISHKLAAGTSGRVVMKIAQSDAVNAILGFDTLNAPTDYQQLDAGVWRPDFPADGLYKIDQGAGGGTTPGSAGGGTAETLQVSNFVGIFRDHTTGRVYLQKLAAGGSWYDVTTYLFTSTTDLFITLTLEQTNGKAYYLGGKGMTAL